MGRVGGITFLKGSFLAIVLFWTFFSSTLLRANEENRIERGERQAVSQEILAEKRMKLAELEREWQALSDPERSTPKRSTDHFCTERDRAAKGSSAERKREELDALRAVQLKMRRERVAAVERAKAMQITAHIDLSRQRMMVYKGEKLLYKWRVSTARRGYVTPTGVYRPQYLERMHYSKRYHHSPMPHSIFFRGNFAIHGTNSIGHLGRRASHGCIRLHPRHARKLYSMIQKYGKSNTVIKITY